MTCDNFQLAKIINSTNLKTKYLMIYIKSHYSKTGNMEKPKINMVYLLKKAIITLQFDELIIWKDYWPRLKNISKKFCL